VKLARYAVQAVFDGVDRFRQDMDITTDTSFGNVIAT